MMFSSYFDHPSGGEGVDGGISRLSEQNETKTNGNEMMWCMLQSTPFVFCACHPIGTNDITKFTVQQPLVICSHQYP